MKNALLLLLLLATGSAYSQSGKGDDYWIAFMDSTEEFSGYMNTKGEVMIPTGKYAACLTDTFRNVAFVLSGKEGYVAIDRKENILYKIFEYDNGPDSLSQGLVRILINKKIGYADEDGQIIIQPQFDCAYPFENGMAKVSNDCKITHDGENTSWSSNHWYYIDRKGQKVKDGN